MNKYQIDQTVYFISSESGRIKVHAMSILAIKLDTKFKYIEYTGACHEMPEDTYKVLEDKLYPSRIDALQEIERQLTELRVHDEPC